MSKPSVLHKNTAFSYGFWASRGITVTFPVFLVRYKVRWEVSVEGRASTHGVSIAVLPLMRKRIARAQLVARREEEEGSAGAVRNAKLAQRFHHRLHAVLVGRDGEHAKGTGSRALLFESLDADFKLQALINLAVLEVAELFVNVVDFCSERRFNS